MLKPFMGLYVNIRNTETSEIRILVYIETYNTQIELTRWLCVYSYTVDTKTRFDFIWELITWKQFSKLKNCLKVLYVVFY